MKVKELKEILEKYADNIEITFEDVCGNWQFEIYSYEEIIDNYGKLNINLIGDEL